MSDRDEVLKDIPTEKALLGSCLLVSDAVDVVSQIVSPESFYLLAHQKIFAAMLRLAARCSGAFDSMMVSRELERVKDSLGRSDLEDIGGEEYLEELLDGVPHAAHAKFYAETVRDKYILRSLAYAGRQITADAYDGEEQDPAELIAKAADQIQKISESRVSQRTGLQADVQEFLTDLNEENLPGLLAGFPKFDRITGGLRPGNLVVLAARTSVGKTAFALNVTRNAAESGSPVLFVSLEMQRREILSRLLAMTSGVNGLRIRDRKLDGRERRDLEQAAQIVTGWPLVIDDDAGQTVQQIASTARWMRSRQGLGLVVVDYLQLIRAIDQRTSREQQVAMVSRDLKNLAKQLDCPVIALCQLSRAVENRESKKPRLSDLRESGSIEQDADIVAFLNRPALYDFDRNVREIELIVAKNRAGECGDVILDWDSSCLRYTEREANLNPFTESTGFESWEDIDLPDYSGEVTHGDF